MLSKRRLKVLDRYYNYKHLKHLIKMNQLYCKTIVVQVIRGIDSSMIETALSMNKKEIQQKKELLNIYGKP